MGILQRMAHLSPNEILENLQNAADTVEVGARYVHFKNPSKEYEVTGFAIIEADDSVGVLYKALYDEGFTFVRSLESFTATVEHQGQSMPRFRKVP